MNSKGKFDLKQANNQVRGSRRLLSSERGVAVAAFLCGAAISLMGSSAYAQASAAHQAVLGTAKCDSVVAAKIASLPKSGTASVSGWSSVIVHVTGGSSLDAAGEKSLASLGGDVYRRLPLIGSVAVRIPSRNLGKLADLPFVAHLSQDGSVLKNDEFTIEGSGGGGMNSDYSLDGSGVGVAVMDSGIHSHPDLKGYNAGPTRIIASVNFSADSSAVDDCGHGTHIAGIIAGNGAASSKANNFQTFYGIARNANLVNVRVLDSEGQGTVSNVITGIAWTIKHASTYNIRVLNLSLGHPVTDYYANDPLCQAVEAAYKAGIVVVCAAGNNGRLSATNTPGAANEGWGTAYGSIQSPGNDPYVITVGAMKQGAGSRSTDTIATYSSRGPSLGDGVLKPDIVAPGNRVISTLANGSYLDTLYGATNGVPISSYTSNNNDNSSKKYFYLSGTSMAAPVVAGAAALLIQQNPNLTPDTVKARLMLSADKWANANGSFDACTYGAGYLDIPAALKSPIVAIRAIVSPLAGRDGFGNVIVDYTHSVTSITSGLFGKSTVWGISGVTGLQSVYGSGAIMNLNLISGTQFLLSAALTNSVTVAGDQVLWGGSPGDGDGVTTPQPPADPTDPSDPSDPSNGTSDSASVDLSSTVVTGE